MKKIILIILLVLIGRYLFINFIQKEEWSGFFYPNAYNLSTWTESDKIFDNIESCRLWAENEAISYTIRNPELANEYPWDYECGLNCKMNSTYGLNVCEETIH